MSTTESHNPKNRAAASERRIDISLLPAAGIIHGAHACMDGAGRYGPYNWRDEKIAIRAYLSAEMRHLLAFLDGEDCCPKSGAHHLGHMIAGCAIVLDAIESGTAIDDRPPKGNAAEILERLKVQMSKCLKEESGGTE